jgi:hypothetical protein
MPYHKFVWVLKVRGVQNKLIQVRLSYTDEFKITQVVGLQFSEGINDKNIFKNGSPVGEWFVFEIMKREKTIEFFESFIIFSNSDIEQLILLSELNANGDLKLIGFPTIQSLTSFMGKILGTQPKHLNVRSGVIDFGKDKFMNTAPPRFIKKVIYLKRTVFKAKGCMTIQIHGKNREFLRQQLQSSVPLFR